MSRHEALGYGNEEGRLKSWLSREGLSPRTRHITLNGLTKCVDTAAVRESLLTEELSECKHRQVRQTNLQPERIIISVR